MNRNKITHKIPKAVYFAAVLILAAVMIISAVKKDRRLTYSLYPYLPETEYCTDILEEEWKKLYPEIDLEYPRIYLRIRPLYA